MKQLLLLILLIFPIGLLFGQKESFVLSGKLVDKQSHNPIDNIKILNITQKNFTYSNNTGLFKTICSKNDTLVFSGMGYFPKQLTINDSIIAKLDFLLLYLEPEFYELKEVTINNLGTYNDFKRNFLTIKPKQDFVIDLGIPGVKPGIPRLLDDDYVKSAGFAIKSPISFLYYNLNEKEKSKRKIYKLIYEAPITYEIEKKYNRDKVGKWTGLTDFELNEFIVFCNFDRNFLLHANEIEIIIKTMEKLKEFQQKKEAGNNNK